MKGKIIINIPEKCDNCILITAFWNYGRWCCKLTGGEVFAEDKPEWCPIEPIEENSNKTKGYINGVYIGDV